MSKMKGAQQTWQMSNLRLGVVEGMSYMSMECNKDESRDIGVAVACLFTNVFFKLGGGRKRWSCDLWLLLYYFLNITLCTISYGTPKTEMVDG